MGCSQHVFRPKRPGCSRTISQGPTLRAGQAQGSDRLAMTEAALPILVLALVLGGALALYPHPIDWEREDQNR